MGSRRVRRIAIVGVAVAVVGLLPTAATAAATTPPWIDEITFNGLLETSYSWNANHPDSRQNQLRVFDFDDATFRVDEFELVAQRVAAKPRETGFRVDLTLGSAVPRVTASAGLFRDAAGVAGDFDAHQAFVSYVAPLGAGVKIDAGKFITPVGAEVIDGYDGWNDQATRSLLFGYAIPFTHVGVRATTPITPHVAALLMVVNGWDVARDDNRAKTVGGQVTVTPGAGVTASLSGLWGREGVAIRSRGLIDLVAGWNLHDRLVLGINADWGQDLGYARWNGAALYVRGAVTSTLALCGRIEGFNDLEGVRTGTSQSLSSFTLTPEWKLGPKTILRGDARFDHSDQAVFEHHHELAHWQPTLMTQLLLAF